MRYWTKEETEKLRLLYPTLLDKDLRTHFPNRNDGSIHYKAMNMRLKKSANFFDPSPPIISEIEKAYLAGLFDGEGCIYIRLGKRWGSQKSPRHQLVIVLANTDKNIINYFQKLFGGDIYTPMPKNGEQKCYWWRLSAKRAEMFLKLIGPLLRIKKTQTKIALEFQKKMKYNGFALTEEVIHERESYRFRLSNLKGARNRLKPL